MDNRICQNGLIAHAISCALAMALLLVAHPCAAGGTTSTSQARAAITGSKYVYYPDKAKPYFNYEDTEAFASRFMVIPPTVPIITQPAYLYMNAPDAKVTQAPLPILDTNMPPK